MRNLKDFSHASKVLDYWKECFPVRAMSIEHRVLRQYRHCPLVSAVI